MDWGSVGTAVVRVLVAGLLLGAGLPAVFALGVRAWAAGTGGTAPDGTTTPGRPAALAVGAVAFAVVIAAVVLGVLWITRTSLHHYLGISVFGA